MIRANVILDNSIWKKKIKNPKKYIQKRLKVVSKICHSKKKKQEFTLLLTNNKKMKILNNKFRKKNKSTDVLSFPFCEKDQLDNKIKKEKEIYLGDIIINLSQVKNKNNELKFKEELNKLWIHGLLHLLGYDHKSNTKYLKMQKLENKFSYLIKKNA